MDENTKAIGSLEAKVDMMLQTLQRMDNTLTSLPNTYVTRAEYEDLKERMTKQESAFRQWAPIVIAGIALLSQFFKGAA